MEDMCPLLHPGTTRPGVREAAENGWPLLTRVRVDTERRACQSEDPMERGAWERDARPEPDNKEETEI